MKITLTTNIGVLGESGEQIEVSATLGQGLIRRRQAKKGWENSFDDKTVKELQDIAKEKGVSYSGLKKADLIKELKESIETKQDKEPYETK
ncbi:Rho termination factor N-terminal domain-containing protein [Gracilimonas sp.]|uniref:Rho termination factor N-terminal domain-containing protein n=1 Tax=Gracilimonas sp. TaxID=1974203 RepID=UPI002872884A|nr:Rho termination factor N-terminal domain-containing protein [Gracilimonas sp.]